MAVGVREGVARVEGVRAVPEAVGGRVVARRAAAAKVAVVMEEVVMGEGDARAVEREAEERPGGTLVGAMGAVVTAKGMWGEEGMLAALTAVAGKEEEGRGGAGRWEAGEVGGTQEAPKEGRGRWEQVVVMAEVATGGGADWGAKARAAVVMVLGPRVAAARASEGREAAEMVAVGWAVWLVEEAAETEIVGGVEGTGALVLSAGEANAGGGRVQAESGLEAVAADALVMVEAGSGVWMAVEGLGQGARALEGLGMEEAEAMALVCKAEALVPTVAGAGEMAPADLGMVGVGAMALEASAADRVVGRAMAKVGWVAVDTEAPPPGE